MGPINKNEIKYNYDPALYTAIEKEYGKNKSFTSHDPEFAKYLKSKKIVVVGPAPHMIGSKQGNLIDAYDIVIRIGKSIPVPEHLIEDIGHRTDVLYNPFNNRNDARGGGTIDIDKWSSILKWVSSPNTGDQFAIDRDNSFLELNKGRILFHPSDYNFLRPIEKIAKTRFNTGFIAILDLLRYDIKELYITGFNFHSSKRGFYYQEYRPPNAIIEGVHNPKIQLIMMKLIYEMDNRIICDNKLKEVMEESFLFPRFLLKNKLKREIEKLKYDYIYSKLPDIAKKINFPDTSNFSFIFDRLNVKSLCDAGAGMGEFCKWALDSKRIPQVIAIDFSSKNRKVIPNLTYYIDYLHDIRLQNDDVEYVICFNTLHYVIESDIDLILSEFNRISTKGFIFKIDYNKQEDNFYDKKFQKLNIISKSKEWWENKIRRYGQIFYINEYMYIDLYKNVALDRNYFNIQMIDFYDIIDMDTIEKIFNIYQKIYKIDRTILLQNVINEIRFNNKLYNIDTNFSYNSCPMICRDSICEEDMYLLCKYAKNKTFIIETGAGESTKQLANVSIINNTTMVSIDANPKRAKKIPGVESITGWSITYEDIIKYKDPLFIKWKGGNPIDGKIAAGDKSLMTGEDDLIRKTINRINKDLDFFFCDTGEYCGLAEWRIVKNKIKIGGIFAAHDIYYPKSIKCFQVCEQIEADPNWKVLEKTNNDEKGLLIAQRIS